MIRRLVPCLTLVLLAGCMEGKKDTPLSRTSSLYTRLGGEPGIAKVVDDFVANMILSKEIRERHKEHFIKGDVRGLKRKLIDQIGDATGGPQKYAGKDMKDAHVGLGITDADFDATVASLKKSLDENKVAAKEQDELFALLGPMRKDVVEK